MTAPQDPRTARRTSTCRRGSAAVLGALAALALAPGAASASSVLFHQDGDVWLSSLDGAQKLQVTTDGAGEDGRWSYVAHAPDGSFVAARGKAGTWALRRFAGPKAEPAEVQVLPRRQYAGLQVYPLSMGISDDGGLVAYMHSSCSFACQSVTQGTWLTFSRFPSNTTDPPEFHLRFARFVGRRLVGSSGGDIVVQPDVPEAPMTQDLRVWLHSDTAALGQAAVSVAGEMVAVTYSGRESDEAGIVVARTAGVPGPISDACELPVAGVGGSVSFTPDGRHIAWQDDRGVVVAGAPALGGGAQECALTEPARVVAPQGRGPSLGGADVAAILAARAPGPAGPGTGGGGTGGGGTGGGGTPGTTPPAGGGGPAAAPGAGTAAPVPSVARLRLRLPARTTAARLRRGLPVRVTAPAAGRVTVTATVSRAVARRLGLRVAAPAGAARIAARSSRVVVARGTVRARAAGPVTVRLRPTATARKRLARLRGRSVVVRAAQGRATATATLRVR